MRTDLEICDDGHASVAFSRNLSCPVCEAKRETKESDRELSTALAKIEELREEIETLKERLGAAQ